MPETTITIDRDQRDGLYELVRNHLGSIEDLWVALERCRDFAAAEQLGLEFARDFRLLQDIGWGDDEGAAAFELTMPPRDLTELLDRLKCDAKRLIDSPSERRAIEADGAVNERFRRGMEACTELLADLVSEGGSVGTSGFQCSESTPPPEINHVVVTGTLSADPHLGRSAAGEPVTLLWIEFPVADPARPEALWARASCLAEVPNGRTTQDVMELRGGASVLISGQLSDRWVIESGHTSRRGIIVASLVKAGPPPAQLELSG